MITDPVKVAGLVARAVRSGTRGGGPTKIVVAQRVYHADPADLWDALTDPERIPRWFLPVSGDFEPGGRYQFEGQAGGLIERCDRPDRLAVTWEMGEMVSWLELRLGPCDGGTTLELVHEAPVDPDMWAQFGPGAVGVGWDLALLGLALHLESGEAVDPAEAMAFTFTPEGRELVGLVAEAWADGAVADGDDPDQARRSAEAVVAFYTTDPGATDPGDADPAAEPDAADPGTAG